MLCNMINHMGTVYPSVCQEGGRSQKEAAATARDQSATDHPPEQTSLSLLQSRPSSFASLPELRSHKKQIWFHILPPSVSSSSYSILDRNQQRDVQALQLDPLGGRPCQQREPSCPVSTHQSPEMIFPSPQVPPEGFLSFILSNLLPRSPPPPPNASLLQLHLAAPGHLLPAPDNHLMAGAHGPGHLAQVGGGAPGGQFQPPHPHLSHPAPPG